MPTRLADDVHAGSPACPSLEQLRLYLNGWTDDEQAEQLEQHLTECPDCRQAMSDCKPPADTLLQSLQSTVAHRSADAAGDMESEEQPIAEAIERVKQFVDKPADSAVIRQAWQPAQREIGVYDLQRPLGRGGMGAVYLATHRQLRKQVAIKLLPILSAEDSDVRARFDREIRVVGKLNHPSIVAATDAGEVDGTQFLVMEYVPGMDLSRLARVMGRLPVAEACELMRQVALGLSCAHAEGVVHRDIKPSNLMLDDTGRIRILDFGLAQLSVWDEVSIDLTTVGQLMGTLDYMAPEQAEVSNGVDYRADLYALGATLFRLLCGRPPLAAAPNQSPLEKLRLLANHQPPKLSTLCPEAPEELVSLVSSLLSRDPQDRPASAAHVAEQLAPFAVGATLVELLQQAKKKAAASPEVGNRRTFAESLPEGPDGLMGTRRADALPLALLGHIGTGRTSRLRRWLLAASIPLLIVAGILIKLELDKGQLIIESDVADVRVSLLKDGQTVDGIQVTQGTTSTRLKADKYEITIDGPSDGLTIDKDMFTLKNGETVVARIRSISGDTVIGASFDEAEFHSAVDESGIADEPRFKDKPLSHWLSVLQRDSARESQLEALNACRSIGEAGIGDPELITSAMLHFIATRKHLDGASTDGQVEALMVSVLRKVNPGRKFFELWVEQMVNAHGAFRQQLWHAVRLNAGASWQDGPTSWDDVQPLVAWAGTLLQMPLTDQDANSIRADAEQAGEVLLEYLDAAQFPADYEVVGQVSSLLMSSQWLGDRFWLGRPFVWFAGPAELRRDWPASVSNHIKERAIAVLEESGADASLVTQAALVLASHGALTAEEQRAVSAATADRIRTLFADEHAISQSVIVAQPFRTMLRWDDPGTSRLISRNVNVMHSDPTDLRYFSIQGLLDLSLAMDNGVGVRETLDQVVTHCPDSMALIAMLQELGRRSEFRSCSIRIIVPSLECSERVDNVTQFSLLRELTRLRRGQAVSRGEWMRYIGLNHPVMAPSSVHATGLPPAVDSASPSQADGNHERNALSGSSDQPLLYEGQPLDYWLDVMRREQSPAGLSSAFDACSALMTNENREQIADSAFELVARIDASTLLTSRVMGNQSLSNVAGGILNEACPGPAYWERWIKAMESADAASQERLWEYWFPVLQADGDGTDGSRGEVMDLTVLLDWAEKHLSAQRSSEGAVATFSQRIADCLRMLLNPHELSGATNHDARLRSIISVRRNGRISQAGLQRIQSLLFGSEILDDHWWLNQPLRFEPAGQATSPEGEAIRAEVMHRALRVFQDLDAQPALVVQAGMILSQVPDMNTESKSAVVTALRQRLTAVCGNEVERTRVVRTTWAFARMFPPSVDDLSPLRVGSLRVSYSRALQSGNWWPDRSVTVQLLHVVSMFDVESLVQSELRLLVSELRETLDRVNAARRIHLLASEKSVANVDFATAQGHLKILWPELIVDMREDIGFLPEERIRAEYRERVAVIWGDHEPTHEDWLKYLILLHPVMRETVAKAIEEPAPAAAAEGTAAP